MDAGTFDGLVRRAARITDRRQSLKLLGGSIAAIAATRVASTGASKAGKRARKKCRNQRGQCLAFVQRRCEADIRKRATGDIGAAEVDPQCVADFNPCCESFAKCQAGAGLRCLTARREMEAQ